MWIRVFLFSVLRRHLHDIILCICSAFNWLWHKAVAQMFHYVEDINISRSCLLLVQTLKQLDDFGVRLQYIESVKSIILTVIGECINWPIFSKVKEMGL